MAWVVAWAIDPDPPPAAKSGRVGMVRGGWGHRRELVAARAQYTCSHYRNTSTQLYAKRGNITGREDAE